MMLRHVLVTYSNNIYFVTILQRMKIYLGMKSVKLLLMLSIYENVHTVQTVQISTPKHKVIRTTTEASHWNDFEGRDLLTGNGCSYSIMRLLHKQSHISYKLL